MSLPVPQDAAPDLTVFWIEQLHAIIFTFQGLEQTPGLRFGHISFGGRARFGLLLISILPVFVFPELGSVLQIAFFLALLGILIRLFPGLSVLFVAFFILLFLVVGFIALLLLFILISLSRFVLLLFALALFVR